MSSSALHAANLCSITAWSIPAIYSSLQILIYNSRISNWNDAFDISVTEKPQLYDATHVGFQLLAI